MSWTPTARSSNARFYVWEPHAQRPLRVRSVRIVTVGRHGRQSVHTISTRLLGSDYPLEQQRLTAITGADERYYFESRWKGAKLAVTAFVHHPLRGLGWEQFPVLSNRKLPFGPLPTHDEYLRFAAETGILGLLLLLAVAGCAIAGVRRMPFETTRVALAGTLLAGGVSFVFVNGAVAPGAGAWVGVAAAAAVALATRRRREPEPPRAGE
jgi:O-antigen ligase